MRKSLFTAKGFTLIELLIVISIIAILVTIGVVTYSGIQKNARDAKRKVDINTIAEAWEMHISKTTPKYPALQEDWFSAGVYPKDPSTNSNYNYVSGGANETTGADTFKVCATLGDDLGVCTTTGASCYCRTNIQ
ncbi:MAG: type II secretion system protein [Candidatus Daviesbacteria bacterium]